MERILVGMDGSDESKHAARWAAQLATPLGAEVLLAHVLVPICLPPDATRVGNLPQLEALRMGQARDMLQQSELDLRPTEARVRTVVLEGFSAAEVLSEEAKKADLVVVGSRGLGSVKELLLGSTSHKLAHLCSKPLTIVR